MVADAPDENCTSLLANDPVFEISFEELDEDDKRELGDVKNAINKRKAQRSGKRKPLTHLVGRRKKPRGASSSGGGGAPPAPAEPPPGAPAPAPPAVEPPPGAPAPAMPPVVVEPEPDGLTGDYRSVRFGHGYIVYSVSLRKINAHCHVHAEPKCHCDRSVPLDGPWANPRVKGRPLGFLALWLLKARDDTSKLEHHISKKVYARPAFHVERKEARKALWALRETHPRVVELFTVERQNVPLGFLGDEPVQLYEPEDVF